MLTISPAATEAIKGLVAASDLPEGAGIRISTHPQAPGALELSLASQAAEADAVVEKEGATIFLEEQTATLLADKRLDAQIEGDAVAFSIVDDEPDAPPA